MARVRTGDGRHTAHRGSRRRGEADVQLSRQHRPESVRDRAGASARRRISESRRHRRDVDTR